MPSTKHQNWKSRWSVDETDTRATHDSGLRVAVQGDQVVAENAEEVVQLLTPQHGAHNAPAMVQRLLREGAQMLIDPTARGWRH